jgi:hypothetical protein
VGELLYGRRSRRGGSWFTLAGRAPVKPQVPSSWSPSLSQRGQAVPRPRSSAGAANAGRRTCKSGRLAVLRHETWRAAWQPRGLGSLPRIAVASNGRAGCLTVAVSDLGL